MAVRIALKDLPLRDTRPLYQFTYWVGQQRPRCHRLDEGEITIGSSSRCDIRIRASGVSSRHVRLKRHGDQVFIQALGHAKIVVDDQVIEGFMPLAQAQPFTFGAVTAQVESLFPADRQPAVQVTPVAMQSLLEDESEQIPEIAIQTWSGFNDTLAQLLHNPDAPGGALLLETLHQSLAPIATALFRRQGHAEWVLLAERVINGEPSILDPEATEGYTSFRLQAGEHEFLLLVIFSEDVEATWQREVCRHLLMLIALWEARHAGSKAQNGSIDSPSPPPSPQADVWHEFVGSRIRTYLFGCTEMCRYADTVLILGETGTGKELVARALHRLWERAGEFIALNCAAIPGELLDAELFGVEAGAATGVSARRGRIAQAEGGTLFLDEISELPLHLQGKLLRVLQEREYFSIGGTTLQQANVHIVAASNRVAKDLCAGQMRQDLYFRLTQTVISLPPLRERTDDLAALCVHFLQQWEGQLGRGITGLSLSALHRLQAYAWPGNVRELQNMLRSLYARVPPGSLIQRIHLPAELQTKPQVPVTGRLADILQEVERQVIAQEIQRQQTIPATAKVLGLSEGYLYRKLKKLGVRTNKQ